MQSKGYYDKSSVGTFCFAEKDFTKASVTIPDRVYTGSPITLGTDELTMTLKGVEEPLAFDPEHPDDSDFTIVSYDKNTNAGTATAVLKGNPKKRYAGEKTVTFKIVARQMYETIHYDANLYNEDSDLYTALLMEGIVTSLDDFESKYQVVGTMKDSVIPKGGKLAKNAFKVQKKDARGRWVTATEVRLAGWNTKPDGTGKHFADQAAFTPSWISAQLYGENWMLYAQWEVTP